MRGIVRMGLPADSSDHCFMNSPSDVDAIAALAAATFWSNRSKSCWRVGGFGGWEGAAPPPRPPGRGRAHPADRVRSGMGLPVQLVVGNALQRFPRAGHFMCKLG